MLRSAGFFRLLICPFTSERGSCSRPHCQFRHVAPEQKGDGDDTCKNLQELERIKKAIEAVKNEVEEKQKTLLLYTNGTQSVEDPAVKVDSNCNIVEDTVEKLQNTSKTSTAVPVSTKSSNPIVKKYIVDRSCPATDLEYDPLLNYSAGFFGSTTKEKENEKKPKRKHSSEEELDNTQKRLRSASPIRLEIKFQESDDEDMLVIDVPPLLEVSKKPRASKVRGIKAPLLYDESVPDERKVLLIDNGQDVIVAPIEDNVEVKLDSVNETFPSSMGIADHTNDNGQILDSSNNFTSSELDPSSEIKGLTSDSLITVSSDENVSTCSKPVVEESDCLVCHIPFQEESLKQIEFLHDDAKYSINDKAAEVTISENSSDSIVIDEQKCEEEVVRSFEDEVIVVNSSSDMENSSDEETGLSDSDDPMEECRRIFNEFTENEAKKKSAQIKDESEMEVQQAKEVDAIPGQKKRVAHPTPKCDVKTSGTILVPFRGATTQQMPHPRIVHVQQQALQITSAIKNGQALVSSQKRISSCLTPTHHNLSQIVCLNVVEVQPVLPARSQLSGLVQGSTCIKSIMPQKRTIPTTALKIPTRKRQSVTTESGCKVPHDIRQRYVNSFVEEFLKESQTVQEAFDKALLEEKSIYDRCGSKNMYLNIAVNSLKKLRDQHNVQLGLPISGSRKMKGGSKKQVDKNELAGPDLYNILKDYLLSEDQLMENGYPRPHPDKPGSAIIQCTVTKTIGSDALRRVCSRCGETYSVTPQGKHLRKEECTFHSGRVLRHKVPGGLETRYSCCEAAVGTPGCQMAKLHVHDGQRENLDGFIKTFVKLQPSDGNPGIFSVDCEMCYTTQGLELARVTVVDSSLQVVYDTFVKPDNEIIDYNTRFSGVTEENLKNITTSIRDVQAIMLNLFSADTILIGHGLENDLVALKLIHDTVVDTSIVFPHRLGLPYKRALRSLIADYLRRIIQDEVSEPVIYLICNSGHNIFWSFSYSALRKYSAP
ncbi:RNA exonuclease 1 homolog isoform X1 [Ranitomeya variabilis]|uniref:RNA exonuclease 1 homolog isoform X1 n=1 Tax=Ranitomeya variabilis TaxID=490064 RepID=UPI004056EE5B